MQHSVRPVVVVLLGTFLAVCVGAGVVVFNWVVRRLVSKAWPPAWLRTAARVGIVAIAALGLLCAAYAYWIEPCWLDVTHLNLKSAKLPKGTRPIRIVQISDLHCEGKVRCEDRLPGVIAAQKPDIIVYTGDSVNTREGLDVFRRCITQVAAIAPTFGIMGSHEGGAFRKNGIFDGTGVCFLQGHVVTLEVAGAKITLAAALGGNHKHLADLLEPTKGNCTVHLSHYPAGVEALAGLPIDLCLAGSTHGGQVVLPFLGAVERDQQYVSGLYNVNGLAVYVNRGIGMSADGAPVRFGARPEVTVVEIAPSD